MASAAAVSSSSNANMLSQWLILCRVLVELEAEHHHHNRPSSLAAGHAYLETGGFDQTMENSEKGCANPTTKIILEKPPTWFMAIDPRNAGVNMASARSPTLEANVRRRKIPVSHTGALGNDSTSGLDRPGCIYHRKRNLSAFSHLSERA
jgi:hypothetical protein